MNSERKAFSSSLRSTLRTTMLENMLVISFGPRFTLRLQQLSRSVRMKRGACRNIFTPLRGDQEGNILFNEKNVGDIEKKSEIVKRHKR